MVGSRPLDEALFNDALKTALKDYARPDRLRNNPLLDSRLVASAVDGDAEPARRVAALRELIAAQAERLEQAPKTAILKQILERTYLRPERSHDDAAQALSLPPRTYRRHLNDAVSVLTAYLWEAESTAQAQDSKGHSAHVSARP